MEFSGQYLHVANHRHDIYLLLKNELIFVSCRDFILASYTIDHAPILTVPGRDMLASVHAGINLL